MFTSLRLTTSVFKRQLACCAGACVALLGLPAAPAVAFSGTPEECEEISQPFAAFKDFNYYKLVPGGEFNSAAEGWELSGGAQIITATRPDGTTAGVLDIPGGGKAISPPMEVTLQDPTARVWVRDVKGGEGVQVSVSYLNTATATHPKGIGSVHGQQTAWTLSNPFAIQPQTAGSQEGPRTVRFVLTVGKSNDTRLYGLWVDPRMRGEGRECPVPQMSSPLAGASQATPSTGGTVAPAQSAHPHHQHHGKHRPSTRHSRSATGGSTGATTPGGGGSTGTTPSRGGGLTVREGETPAGVH